MSDPAGMSALARLGVGAMLLCAASVAASASAATAWPRIDLPPQASQRGMPSLVIIDGRPTRLQRFVATGSTSALVDWFHDRLGAGSVVAPLPGDGWVIGRAQASYYLSVQLTPAAQGGVIGVAAVAQFRGALRRRQEALRAVRRLLPELPADAEVLHDVQSEGRGGTTQALVIVDRGGLDWNADCLRSSLRRAGFSSVPDPGEARGTQQRWLRFRSADREVVAMLQRLQGARTAIVLQVSPGGGS